MDTAQWPQDVGLMKAMDEHDEIRSGNICNRGIGGERVRSRPQEQVKCPRCKSSNTKFCYYNNYSLTQPRYLCKGCRRYWTEGGSLRNVPVGGGSRKNKRPSSSYNLPDLNPPHQIPNSYKTNQSAHHEDLNLSFQEPQLAKMEKQHNNNPSSSSSSSALDLLRTGIAGRGLNSFIPTPMPDSNTLYSSSASPSLMQEFKPLSFPVGNENNNGGGRLFFPFWDFNKQPAATTVVDAHQHKGGQGTNPNTYRNGVLHGGGGSW